MLRFTRNLAIVAVVAGTAGPALAANQLQGLQGVEHHRAAFAGLTVRVDPSGSPGVATPKMRLGLGFVQDRRNSAGDFAGRTVSAMPISLGIADRRVQLFAGDEQVVRTKQRLGLTGEQTALLVIGGLAVGAVAVVLLTDKEKDRTRNPCPPGVEVCIF